MHCPQPAVHVNLLFDTRVTRASTKDVLRIIFHTMRFQNLQELIFKANFSMMRFLAMNVLDRRIKIARGISRHCRVGGRSFSSHIQPDARSVHLSRRFATRLGSREKSPRIFASLALDFHAASNAVRADCFGHDVQMREGLVLTKSVRYSLPLNAHTNDGGMC